MYSDTSFYFDDERSYARRSASELFRRGRNIRFEDEPSSSSVCLPSYSVVCSFCVVLLLLALGAYVCVSLIHAFAGRENNTQPTTNEGNLPGDVTFNTGVANVQQANESLVIRLDTTDTELFISVAQGSFDEALFFANKGQLFDETVILYDELLLLIGKMLAKKAYWFMGWKNFRRVIWTSAYVEISANAKSTGADETLVRFHRSEFTIKASIVKWCRPWNLLYQYALSYSLGLSGDEKVKIPVIIELYFDVHRAFYGDGLLETCLTLKDYESKGHYGLHRPKRIACPPPPATADKPSFDAKEYVKQTKESKVFKRSTMEIVFFSKGATFAEAQNICRHKDATLITQITQDPPYFTELGENLSSFNGIRFDGSNAVGSVHFIWTGAYFDLKDAVEPRVLRLTNGEKRYDLSVLKNDFCEDSKRYDSIIAKAIRKANAPPKQCSDSPRYLHVVMKYNRSTKAICLALLDDTKTSSLLVTPACQRPSRGPWKGAVVHRTSCPLYIKEGMFYSDFKLICSSKEAHENFTGVPLSETMAGNEMLLYETAFKVFPEKSKSRMWIGAYFDLKSENPSILLWRDGRFKTDPSKLRTWCKDVNYADALEKAKAKVKPYLDRPGEIIVPVVWKASGRLKPGCLEPYTDDILWPGRAAYPALCNEKKLSLKCTGGRANDYVWVPVRPERDVKLYLLDVTTRYPHGYYIYLSQSPSADGLLFIMANYTFQATADLFCRERMNNTPITFANLANVGLFREALKNNLIKINRTENVNQQLYWTGGYFNLNDTQKSTRLRWYGDESFEASISKLSKTLPMCDSVDAEKKIKMKAQEYRDRYANKLKYYPNFEPYVRLAIRFEETPCGVLVWDEFDWPNSVNLYGICEAKEENRPPLKNI